MRGTPPKGHAPDCACVDCSSRPGGSGEWFSIAAVERDTAIAKDTLRVWERRYGFPTPQRDEQGDRHYDRAQLDRLRHIKRALDAGYRPGKVVPMPLDELKALPVRADSMPMAPPVAPDESALKPFIDLILRHEADALQRALNTAMERRGLTAFVREVVAPLNSHVGKAWLGGQMSVHEEHLYTETVQSVLRLGITLVAQSSNRSAPRVLLTTFPEEPHGLGLLMVEAFLAMQGCETVAMGPRMPLPEIDGAARAHRADIVALSFTASQNARDVTASLFELRRRLPAAVEIWAGGQCPVLYKKRTRAEALPVLAMADLGDIAGAVARWRSQRAGLGQPASGAGHGHGQRNTDSSVMRTPTHDPAQPMQGSPRLGRELQQGERD